MKIAASFAFVLLLFRPESCLATGIEYPRAYISEGQVWIQPSTSEARFQATHDCPNKYGPAVSFDRKQIAYGVTCIANGQFLSPMSLVVLDNSGNEHARLTPVSMKKLGSNCAQASDIQWFDDNHVALTCEYNPSVEDYLVINVRTGEVEHEYPGIWFSRSPDRKTVAYVGLILHFAPPTAQNYCLLLNGKTIYTPHCSNEVEPDDRGLFRNIHTFIYPLVWSPDSRNIAFVEQVFDWAFDPPQNNTDIGKSKNNRYYLVIASAHQPARGFRLSETPQSSPGWITKSQIKLDGRIYDLVKSEPGAIP